MMTVSESEDCSIPVIKCFFIFYLSWGVTVCKKQTRSKCADVQDFLRLIRTYFVCFLSFVVNTTLIEAGSVQLLPEALLIYSASLPESCPELIHALFDILL